MLLVCILFECLVSERCVFNSLAIVLILFSIIRPNHYCTDIFPLFLVSLLTVAARTVEAVYSGNLWVPVRILQCGVQAPKTFSQGVVFIVLDQLLDSHTQTHTHMYMFAFLLLQVTFFPQMPDDDDDDDCVLEISCTTTTLCEIIYYIMNPDFILNPVVLILNQGFWFCKM